MALEFTYLLIYEYAHLSLDLHKCMSKYWLNVREKEILNHIPPIFYNPTAVKSREGERGV